MESRGFQVLYRKWRPKTWDELVGQEHVTQTLVNAIKKGKIAHAYLFCGPRGTGKTSTGRILAKAVNCRFPKDANPCNACEICVLINEGRCMDLVEIDAASNRGIDEIRDLREKVHYVPTLARYKVYIIDEVHMLTEPAFNALLKTLEEPPSYVIFILATTEVHKVPLTILSRCQRFDFRRLSLSAIMQKLSEICGREGVEIDPQALRLIARSASGSLRDAENLLEQLITRYGSSISLEQVRRELGFWADSRLNEFARSVLDYDVRRGLSLIAEAAVDGVDFREFRRSLIEFLRELLLVKAQAWEGLELSPEELEERKELAERLTLEEIARAIRIFAESDFRQDPSSPLPLELALVRFAQDRGLGERGEEARKPVSEKPPESRPSELIKTEPAEARKEPEPARASGPPVLRAEAEIPPESPPELLEIRRRWHEFVNACRGEGSSGNLDALLRRACEPVGLEGQTLILGIYPKMEFQYRKLSDPKYQHLVQKKLLEFFGVPYKIRCIKLEERPRKSRASGGTLIRTALEMGAKMISEERNG